MQIKYKSSTGGGMRPMGDMVAASFQQAVQLHQHGQLAQAQLLYEQVLKAQPKHSQALHLQGVLAFQTGNYQRAVELIGKAIRLDASHAAFHCNLGNAQLKLKELYAAVVCYDRALRIKPDFADAHANRGVALAELLQFEAAIASYDHAIAVNPNYAEAYYNRGNALLELGQTDAAIASIDRAIALQPAIADFYCARGVARGVQGRVDEAQADYRQALVLMPDSAKAHCGLAAALTEQGKVEEAMASYTHVLGACESIEAKRGFARCLRRMQFTNASPAFRTLVVRAISEAWTRPAQLFAPAISIVKLDRTVQECMERANKAWPQRLSMDELFGASGLFQVANDPLMQCILECMPISSVDVERFLTMTRRVLLGRCVETGDVGDDETVLLCAIARQCYINEYVFSPTAEESTQVQILLDMIGVSVKSQSPVSGAQLAAVAAYTALGSLPYADALADLSWSDPVLALFKQQIYEPATERSYRAHIPQLTPFSDAVSLLVQQQYEENPYPRWINTSGAGHAKSVNAYLLQQFPRAPFQPLAKGGGIDLLIAGCGTGQQSIEAAQLLPDAKLLAVDLSLSSLCYAKRKSFELGAQNVEYAQADIMELGSITQRFDVIESVGVLHHLADPLAGWRVLLGLLRPGGFMRLGFYSELARQNVVAARAHIAQQGYAASATDIRQCRQDLMSAELHGQFDKVLSFRDFFGMSECRDLLFHVQEHRFTVPQIKDALGLLGLNFIGFSVEASVARQYDAMFPEDTSRTNLDQWHVFETANPDVFAGMYQFWVQRSSNPG